MEQNISYIYKKEIDWSVLHQGFTIPIKLKDIFYQNLNIHLKKGESRDIKLMLNSNEHLVKIVNIDFDSAKYPNHKDLIQIRYSPKSSFAFEMREMFSSSYRYIMAERESSDKKRKIFVPDTQQEYIAIYGTPIENVLYVDCFTHNELSEAKSQLGNCSEMNLEQLLDMRDDLADFTIVKKFTKVRKLNRAIGEDLKRAYKYRCQICGEYIGAKYDTNVVHTHHIDPFCRSMNNNPDNIMVICPNHHNVVHTANPNFDRKKLCFTYQNGYSENLKLNLHL